MADINTPVPGITGNFSQLRYPSIDNSYVVFSGFISTGATGVIIDYGGTLSPVVTSSMQVDGKLPIYVEAARNR